MVPSVAQQSGVAPAMAGDRPANRPARDRDGGQDGTEGFAQVFGAMVPSPLPVAIPPAASGTDEPESIRADAKVQSAGPGAPVPRDLDPTKGAEDPLAPDRPEDTIAARAGAVPAGATQEGRAMFLAAPADRAGLVPLDAAGSSDPSHAPAAQTALAMAHAAPTPDLRALGWHEIRGTDAGAGLRQAEGLAADDLPQPDGAGDSTKTPALPDPAQAPSGDAAAAPAALEPGAVATPDATATPLLPPIEGRGADAVTTASVPPASGTADLSRQIAQQTGEALRHLDRGAVEVALAPEELGRVRLVFDGQDTPNPTVLMQAERPETLELMRRHVEILAQDMRDLGYGDVTFLFNDRPEPSGQDRAQDQAPGTEGQGGGPQPLSQSMAVRPRPAGSPDGTLDLRI